MTRTTRKRKIYQKPYKKKPIKSRKKKHIKRGGALKYKITEAFDPLNSKILGEEYKLIYEKEFKQINEIPENKDLKIIELKKGDVITNEKNPTTLEHGWQFVEGDVVRGDNTTHGIIVARASDKRLSTRQAPPPPTHKPPTPPPPYNRSESPAPPYSLLASGPEEGINDKLLESNKKDNRSLKQKYIGPLFGEITSKNQGTLVFEDSRGNFVPSHHDDWYKVINLNTINYDKNKENLLDTLDLDNHVKKGYFDAYTPTNTCYYENYKGLYNEPRFPYNDKKTSIVKLNVPKELPVNPKKKYNKKNNYYKYTLVGCPKHETYFYSDLFTKKHTRDFTTKHKLDKKEKKDTSFHIIRHPCSDKNKTKATFCKTKGGRKTRKTKKSKTYKK